MIVALRRYSTGGWPLLAAVVFYGVLSAPSSARADCGDYIMIGPGSAVRQMNHGPQATFPHLPQHFPYPKSPSNPLAPCSGPNCSRRSLPPAPSPVVSGQTRAENWGVSNLQQLNSELQASALLAFDEPLKTILLTSSVFHPPR